MMKRYLSLPATFLALWALTLLLFSSTASAQTTGQLIGLDNFLAETTGTIVCEDLGSLLDINGDLVPLGGGGDGTTTVQVPLLPSQSISLGQLSFEDDLLLAFLTDDSGSLRPILGFRSPTTDALNPLVLDLDPELGKLEGLFLETGNNIISLFDGDTLLDSFFAIPDVTAPNGDQVGWINTQGFNVTRIELSAPPSTDSSMTFGGLIGTLKASFLPCPEPPAETCFDQLSDAKAEVEALLATSTGKDAHLLQSVVDCICWTQHDCFWVQPSGDRLTDYGSNVFLGNAYSILYLEHVSDPQADVIIDQLLATLECLVDREIEYAIANGGRQANIDKALDFADLADVIDDEFDNQVVASLAFKLAWVNAYYATY